MKVACVLYYASRGNVRTKVACVLYYAFYLSKACVFFYAKYLYKNK